MQPCQRHADDSLALRQSSARETEGEKSFIEGERGEERQETVKEGEMQQFCCTNSKQDTAYSTCESESEHVCVHVIWTERGKIRCFMSLCTMQMCASVGGWCKGVCF